MRDGGVIMKTNDIESLYFRVLKIKKIIGIF